jgi:hypothetical protein
MSIQPTKQPDFWISEGWLQFEEEELNLTLVEMWSLGFNVLIRVFILLSFTSFISSLEPQLGSTRVVFQVFIYQNFHIFFCFTYNCFNQFIYSKKIKVWFQCDCVYLYSVKFLTYWKVQIVCPFCWLNLCLISEWICQNHIDSRWFCKSYIGKSRWITVILPTVIPNIYSGYEWKFESSSSLGEKSHLGMEILIILYNR